MFWWRSSLTKNKLSLTTEQRNKVLDIWNAVEELDKQPQKFSQLYRRHSGNTFYCDEMISTITKTISISSVDLPPTTPASRPPPPSCPLLEYKPNVLKERNEIKCYCTLLWPTNPGTLYIQKQEQKSFCPVKMTSCSKGLDTRMCSFYGHSTSVFEILEE